MAIDLSIVINTRDNLEGLKRLLHSLDQQTFSNDRYEIIVVDDSKGRETTEYVSGLNPVIPTYVTRTEGQGYQNGRNKSFKNVESGLMLFLNDTCVAPCYLLEEHYKAHSKFPHAVVRGPLMPMRGETIQELKHFTAPELDFTIINASIPKLGVAQIEEFNESCSERFQDNEMYWRLNRSSFKTKFIADCYCFQDHRFFQEHSLNTVRSRAERLAASAADYYLSKPGRETLDSLRLSNKLNFIGEFLASNSLGCSFAASLLGGKLEGKGVIQSTVMDAVFCYTFYQKLKDKLKNFA